MASERLTLRLFVALPPPTQWAQEAHRRLLLLPPLPGRLVPWRQWHLTLAFLGEVPQPLVPELVAHVAGLPLSPAVPLICDEVTFWPKPRVVVQTTCSAAPLPWQAYVSKVQAALAAVWPVTERRSWVPHVTLFRSVRTVPVPLPVLPPCVWERPFAPVLFCSRLTSTGARYEALTPQSESCRPAAR